MAERLRRWADLPGFGERTLVMGIVNVTPDSFSGDGIVRADGRLAERALAQAMVMADAGADILDIGAESTRPGAATIPAAEERDRLIPAVATIADKTGLPISVDTRNAATAAAAIAAGASIVNDVSGLTHDPAMAATIAAAGVPVVLMHNTARGSVQQSTLGPRFVGSHYSDVVDEVATALEALVQRAVTAGIGRDRICIDPGIGFGKTREQNLALLDRLDALVALGLPVLLGSSRKSFIGYTLDLPVDQRVEGTAATVAIGIDRGAAIVRVHDVLPMVRVARMTDAIVRPRRG